MSSPTSALPILKASCSRRSSRYKSIASSPKRGLTQMKAAAILGIKQPNVSALMRNRSGNFSVERLMDFLTALGQDVQITVKPTRKDHGAVSVIVA